MQIAERRLPTDADLIERIRERITVKVEQEIRSIPPSDRLWKIDRFIPVVQSMAASDEGRRELAAICAAYLREHKPQTSVSETEAVPYDERAEQRPGEGSGGGGGGRRDGGRPRRRRSGGGGGRR
jgi:hypothetical protein